MERGTWTRAESARGMVCSHMYLRAWYWEERKTELDKVNLQPQGASLQLKSSIQIIKNCLQAEVYYDCKSLRLSWMTGLLCVWYWLLAHRLRLCWILQNSSRHLFILNILHRPNCSCSQSQTLMERRINLVCHRKPIKTYMAPFRVQKYTLMVSAAILSAGTLFIAAETEKTTIRKRSVEIDDFKVVAAGNLSFWVTSYLSIMLRTWPRLTDDRMYCLQTWNLPQLTSVPINICLIVSWDNASQQSQTIQKTMYLWLCDQRLRKSWFQVRCTTTSIPPSLRDTVLHCIPY